MYSSAESHFGSFFALLLTLLLSSGAAQAQGTSFTYQGRLTDSSLPASGSYDLQFKLYDSLAGSTQIGSPTTFEDVAVSAGIFSVTLDFGALAFPGASRWLEIAVRPGVSTGAFTLLSPRQPVTSTPYAIRSLNAAAADGLSTACVNCVTGGQIGALPTGSGNYIQNATSPQSSANFNIIGSGTATGTISANTVNATTRYNIRGNPVLSLGAGVDNLFVGVSAGQANATGNGNSFFGRLAGFSNMGGNDNSFFGASAGAMNVGGDNNSFFGKFTGFLNTEGTNNSFFGRSAGFSNTIGFDNTYFGAFAGEINITGTANSFFGVSAGFNNTGSANAFFGRSAGFQNTSGFDNSFFGAQAGRDNSTGESNAFFGRAAGRASISSDNSFFGASAGEENTVGGNNAFFGSSAGVFNTTGAANAFFGAFAGISNTQGTLNTVIGYLADFSSGNLNHATAIGAATVVTASNRVQIGRKTLDTVAIGAFASPSSATPVCINVDGVFTNCSASSSRHKESVRSWTNGLNVIQRLRPVTFTWKEDNAPDLGLIAEEVAAVEPLLATHNNKGEIEGVKYAQLNMALINAIKEQQGQIAQQRKQIERQESRLAEQQQQIESIKKLMCLTTPQASLCK